MMARRLFTRPFRALVSVLSLLLAGCAALPQGAGVAVEWRPSPNFDERKANFVIIHHTSDDNIEQALGTLTNPLRAVSAHYLIGRDGKIYQLVDERARAWHAGESKWGSNSDINSLSIGIELDNNGQEPFPELQISALLGLLADIKQRLGIPRANFLGHADVAPKRKTDPSRYFPWQRLADQGFGLWCEPPYPVPAPAFEQKVEPGGELQAFGYDSSDLPAAIRAYKRHFARDESAALLSEDDRALLHCLLMKRVALP